MHLAPENLRYSTSAWPHGISESSVMVLAPRVPCAIFTIRMHVHVIQRVDQRNGQKGVCVCSLINLFAAS